MKAGSMAGTVFALGLLAAGSVWAQRAQIQTLKRDPYVGAIVVDAWSGEVLFEDRADEPCYPASVIKLMDLLLILEDAERGEISLGDSVTATAEAARMGGSQVYLKEHETFTVDELLYALMVQSANDAAVALAIWRTGSKDAFVPRMNARAATLGMTGTRFESVHGLPPGAGQKPDISTARDLSRLGRALAQRSDVLQYTSTRQRGFRNDTFGMSNHNHLLGQGGCDGLKTGYFKAGGYSSLTTAARDGRRVVVAVTGSPSRAIRDQNAARLLADGLARAKPGSARAATITPPVKRAPPTTPDEKTPEAEPLPGKPERRRSGVWSKLGLIGIGLVIGLVLAGIGRRRTL